MVMKISITDGRGEMPSMNEPSPTVSTYQIEADCDTPQPLKRRGFLEQP
jgi:hypothetical protein